MCDILIMEGRNVKGSEYFSLLSPRFVECTGIYLVKDKIMVQINI